MNLSKFFASVGLVCFSSLAITAHADPTTDLLTAMKAETQKSDAPSPTSGRNCTFEVQGLDGKNFPDSATAIIAAETAGIGHIVVLGTCSPVRTVRATKPAGLTRTTADKATSKDRVVTTLKSNMDLTGAVIAGL